MDNPLSSYNPKFSDSRFSNQFFLLDHKDILESISELKYEEEVTHPKFTQLDKQLQEDWLHTTKSVSIYLSPLLLFTLTCI